MSQELSGISQTVIKHEKILTFDKIGSYHYETRFNYPFNQTDNKGYQSQIQKVIVFSKI